MSAELQVLTVGYVGDRVAGTVTLLREGEILTHLWWTAEGPAEDPFAPDVAVLRESREKVLALRPALIIPGHGAPFEPGPATPL